MYRCFEWHFTDADPKIVCCWPFNYIELFIKSIIFACKFMKIYIQGVRKGYLIDLYPNGIVITSDNDNYNVMKICALDNADSNAHLDKLRLVTISMFDTFIEREI